MTIEKALIIFDLEKSYTEEQLKKQYRDLMKKNHPDYHMSENEKMQEEYNKKTKEINEAYEILKKNLNRNNQENEDILRKTSQTYQKNSYTYTRKQEPLSKEKINTIKVIKSYYEKCNDLSLMKQVENLISSYILTVQYNSNINIILVNFAIDLEKTYRNYRLLYCKKNHIPSFIMKQKEFDYNCNCKKFYEQIKDCERDISFDLSKTIRKYQYHEHFKILENKILEEKTIIRRKINFNTSKDEYSKILKEYDDTVENIIIEYNKKYRDFRHALNKLNNQLDDKVKEYLYKNIKIIVLQSNDDELIQLLKEAIDESNLTKKTKPKEEIYINLRKKYLANFDFQNIDIINELFVKTVELLYSEKCTSKLADKIDKITFKNPEIEYAQIINTNNINKNKSR